MNRQRASVDVIIPVYNGERYLEQAVRSVLEQSYPATTVFIIDDGSTDHTATLAQDLAGRHPTITYIHKKNGGLSSARNTGIQRAKSTYLAFLDADDIWEPEKLTEQIQVMEQSPLQPQVVYCQYSLIDNEGNPYHDSVPPIFNPQIRGSVFLPLLKTNLISGSGSGVLVARSCFDTCGQFDEQLPACEDWDMWIRLAQQYPFDYVEKPLVRIRRHPDNMSGSSTRMIAGRTLVMNKWLPEAKQTPEIVRYWRQVFWLDTLVTAIREFPRFTALRTLYQNASPTLRATFFIQLFPLFSDVILHLYRALRK